MWITNENNRRIIRMLGRNIGEIFKNCRIGKIKRILGSGLLASDSYAIPFLIVSR